MPANTPRGLPYPLPTEPVAEGAQAIRNLAEAVDAQLGGGEKVYQPCTSDVSTAVPASPGAQFYNFPAATYVAVKHYLELFFPVIRANAAGTLYWVLMEGGTPVAGAGTAGVDIPNISGGFGVTVALRIPFTPTAGSHTYAVNWVGNGTIVFTVKATGLAPATARIVRA
jgi:hypothetical protein